MRLARMLPVPMPAVATFVSQFTSLACWQTHPRIDRPTIFAGPKIHPALVRFAQAMAKASIEVILSNANRMRRTNFDERSRGRPRDVMRTCRGELNPAIQIVRSILCRNLLKALNELCHCCNPICLLHQKLFQWDARPAFVTDIPAAAIGKAVFYICRR